MPTSAALEVTDPLWTAFQQGDRQAFERIHARHYDCLFHYALRLLPDADTARDALQTLFLNLWRTRQRLGAVRSVRAYLLLSLKRQLLADVNRRRLAHRREVAYDTELPHADFSPEDFMVESETDLTQRALLVRMVNQLSARQKEVVYLRYYEELSYQEIADVLHINYQSVANLLQRSLKRLKELSSAPHTTEFLPLLAVAAGLLGC